MGLAGAAVSAASGSAPGGELPACWNAIGVFGDRTCAELAQFIHCRNCPVHASAGLQLLHRDLPAGYRREWAQHFGREREARSSATISVILFRVGEEWLGLRAQLFQEVAEHRYIHSLPHRRQGVVLGLANVRGELLICVSLGHLLGLEPLPSRQALQAHYHRLLVVYWEGNRVGFPVDEVHGPHRFCPDELKQPPATLAKAEPGFIEQMVYWGERAAGVLDGAALFGALDGRLG